MVLIDNGVLLALRMTIILKISRLTPPALANGSLSVVQKVCVSVRIICRVKIDSDS